MTQTQTSVTDEDLATIVPIERQNFEWNLGRLVMNFGALEFNLQEAILELSRNDPQENQRLMPETYGQRVKLLDQLARKRHESPEDSKRRETLIQKMTQAGYRRNHLVHGAWFDRPDVNINNLKGKIVRPDEPGMTIEQFAQKEPRVQMVSWMELAVLGALVVDLIGEFQAYRDALKLAQMKHTTHITPQEQKRPALACRA